MSNEIVQIRKHAKADVAFLGTQLKDAYLFLGSVILGLVVGGVFQMGWKGYVAIPALGFFLNKQYVAWKSERMPGLFRAALYAMGIQGYSPAFNKQKKVFLGDLNIINPANKELLQPIVVPTQEVK